MSIDDYSKEYSDRHWEKMMWFAGLPVTRRMLAMLAEMQRALENKDKGLAIRWAKSIVTLLKSEALIPDAVDSQYEISTADSDSQMVDKIMNSVQIGMQMYKEKGDPADWNEDDRSVGTRTLQEIAEELEGNDENEYDGPVELDWSGLEEDDKDNPPSGPGGDGGNGGSGPAGDPPSGPPRGDGSESAKDDKKTAKGDISKLDVEKVAQTIRDNGEKAGREAAYRIAQTLIDEGNGFPIEDLAEHLFQEALALIPIQDAEEAASIARAEKKMAERDAAREVARNAAQPERNTMDRVAAENAEENREIRPMDDFWNDSSFQAVRRDILKADADKRIEDSKRLLAEALTLANAWSQQYSTGERFNARQILEHVFPANRMQDFDARMAQRDEEEERDARLSDFQTELDNIGFALAESEDADARQQAEALVRRLQNVRGDIAGMTADQILQHVAAGQQGRREDGIDNPPPLPPRQECPTVPPATDELREEDTGQVARDSAQSEIVPEDSVSQQGAIVLPGGAVRNVAMALDMAGEDKAREVAQRTAKKIQGEVPGTVDEIAEMLLEEARSHAKRLEAARAVDPEGVDPQARNGGTGPENTPQAVEAWLRAQRDMQGMINQISAEMQNPTGVLPPEISRIHEELVRSGRLDASVTYQTFTRALMNIAGVAPTPPPLPERPVAQPEQPRPNTMDRVAAENRVDETREAQLSDFRDEIEDIAFALMHRDGQQARDLAEALARRLANVQGKLAGMQAVDILKLVMRMQKKRNDERRGARQPADQTQRDDRGGQRNAPFNLRDTLRDDAKLAQIFAEIVRLMGSDKGRAAEIAMALARRLIKTYGLDIDAKTLAAEILKMAKKTAGKSGGATDQKPGDDPGGSGDGSQGGAPGAAAGGGGKPLTLSDVKKTDWSSVSTLYLDSDENAEEMKAIASEIVKKGADNAGVEKSAKDLLAKAKKSKKTTFKNFRHVVAAIVDAVTKKANGKKVTKPLKASDIPNEEDDRNAA
ncbi:MAG: hypothetical protein AAGB07_10890 [Pseudomonadota bacterium]